MLGGNGTGQPAPERDVLSRRRRSELSPADHARQTPVHVRPEDEPQLLRVFPASRQRRGCALLPEGSVVAGAVELEEGHARDLRYSPCFRASARNLVHYLSLRQHISAQFKPIWTNLVSPGWVGANHT